MSVYRPVALPMFCLLAIAVLVACAGRSHSSGTSDPIATGDELYLADHTSVAGFDQISESQIEAAGQTFSIFYGHTSHGSQIVSGLNMLENEDSLYAFNEGAGTVQISEYSDDLGHNGDTSWVPITRQRLDQEGSTINMVVWSWCGGCSDNTVDGIDTYLAAMNRLELDYPDIIFVYMTGHLEGTGVDGNLYARNNQIRAYCETTNKVLFDFADIESYAPDGTYYPDASDACEWCDDWCGENDCLTCDGCAHSHCFNCYLKGKAFWWLLTRLIPEQA